MKGTTIMMKIAGLALMLSSWTMAQGQQDQKFAQAIKQNALALRQYSWKSQTQIRKEGEVKGTKVYMNRYAPDGTVVQLLVEESSAKLPKFGIRGLVAKKKKEEAIRWWCGLMQTRAGNAGSRSTRTSTRSRCGL